MRTILQEESKLTPNFQTIIPECIRNALHLEVTDTIRYSVLASGDVMIQGIPAPVGQNIAESDSNYLPFANLSAKVTEEIQGLNFDEMTELLAQIELIKRRGEQQL